MPFSESENRIGKPAPHRFRSLFLSDVHLGSRHCQAELLIDFLAAHEAEVIYLIGDILDGWKLQRSRYWPPAQDTVFKALLERARLGARVVYIPGNHDEFVRRYCGRTFRGVEIVARAEHVTRDGRRYLVTHGDEFDVVLRRAKWMAYLGDRFYECALSTNTWVNLARRAFGLGYWSLGAFAKRHVKSFVNIVGQFESNVAEEVKSGGMDGVICGHIHHAVSRRMRGIHYVNTGDWVESCTAVAEGADGSLEVIRWIGSTPRRLEADRADAVGVARGRLQT